MNPTTYVQSIYRGKTTIDRLSPNEEQGRLAGGQRLLQATYIASGSGNADAKDQATNHRTKNEQIEALMSFAESEAILYHHSDNSIVGEYLDNGGEQYVYFHDGTPYVTKFNNIKFHESPLQYFDRLALHNYLFPEAPYTLIGFATMYPEDPSCFSAVVTQPYVIATRGAERSEMKVEMAKMGYNYYKADTYVCPDYIIEDLHPGNALVTPLGHIAIIDPVIYLNSPDDEMGGERLVHNFR